MKKKKTIKKAEEDTTPMIIKSREGNPIATYDAKMVETIKSTVAKNATDEELYMFLKLANEYDLDPFQKELWFIKYQNKDPQIFTSRDGFVKIAKKDPDFKQIRSQPVYENDVFILGHKINENGELVISKFEHEFNPKDKGKVVGAWCSITYHTKPPLIVYSDFEEYKQSTPTWKKNASAMIVKVAEKTACKLSAGISGLYIPEEMGDGFGVDDDLGDFKKARTTSLKMAQSTTEEQSVIDEEDVEIIDVEIEDKELEEMLE